MKRVIITGADGFVGSHTVTYFLSQGIQVLAMDIQEKCRNLKEMQGLEYKSLDIFDLKAVDEAIPEGQYDAWIHFAWEGSAGEKRVDYGIQMKNAMNCVECVKLAKRKGCSRFVGAGSIMEKEVEAVMQTQGSKPGMPYIYGIGKLMAHYMCKTVGAEVGIEVIWMLITNAYGAGEKSPRFINTTVEKLISGQQLTFTAATQNYDFVYVTDVAKAFYLACAKGKAFGEYTIGSSHAKPLKEFIMEMMQEVNPNCSVVFGTVPYTGVNLELEAFSVRQLFEDTGFCSEVSFVEGIKQTKEWLLHG